LPLTLHDRFFGADGSIAVYAFPAKSVYDPDNLDAREGLLQFYAQAPWPIGSSSKAAAQAAEIAKRDPVRGLLAQITLKTSEKKYADATALCESFLKQTPDSFHALYQIGRLASLSGENLDRGIVTLRRCLALTPPPNYATHANVQFRLGTLLQKQGDQPAARAAYQASLKLDPGYKNAADALAKLGS
jgi:tetratricopeptide (TPR) repeat protein